MSRTLTACRSGLSVAAAVVLLTACGGSDGNSASSSSTSSSSASETSADASGSAFCTEAERALQELEPALSGGGEDPAALATALQDAADRLRTIDAPSEIATDWTALADGIEQLAQLATDANDPATATEAQQRSAQILGSLSTPATNVQNYLSSECGIDVGPTGSSAPTS